MSVTVYGASDDLIEIEGDLRDEFSPSHPDGGPDYLGFSDGTVLSIQYTGGFWRIRRIVEGLASYANTRATNEDDDYSDRVTLEGGFSWVMSGFQLCEFRKNAFGKKKKS
jgi:hypothetical protein